MNDELIRNGHQPPHPPRVAGYDMIGSGVLTLTFGGLVQAPSTPDKIKMKNNLYL